MPTPLTLLDRTSKQSHTGTLSSLAFIYAVLQLICKTCLSVRSSLLRTLLTRTPARFQAFHSYLSSLTSSGEHRHSDPAYKMLSQEELGSRPRSTATCLQGQKSRNNIVHFDYFVVDGDLGGEKPCNTFAEKLLKLVVNFAFATDNSVSARCCQLYSLSLTNHTWRADEFDRASCFSV